VAAVGRDVAATLADCGCDTAAVLRHEGACAEYAAHRLISNQ
jgi:Trk K+ transport system NAD-binding subunit